MQLCLPHLVLRLISALIICLKPSLFDFFPKVKYKEDLAWLKGTGCYVWDTPSFALAEKNKVLYSGVSETL